MTRGQAGRPTGRVAAVEVGVAAPVSGSWARHVQPDASLTDEVYFAYHGS